MFTPSTFLSLVLIAASTPALCAPVPFTPVAPRGIASALEGLVGGGVEDLIKAFLHPGNSENSKRSVGSVVEGAASHLIEPIVSGVGSAIGDEIHGILGKVFSRRAFKDLSDDEANTLFEYINNVSKREVDARKFSITGALSGLVEDGLKDLGGSLTEGAVNGIKKLLGSGTAMESAADAATAVAPAATASTDTPSPLKARFFIDSRNFPEPECENPFSSLACIPVPIPEPECENPLSSLECIPVPIVLPTTTTDASSTSATPTETNFDFGPGKTVPQSLGNPVASASDVGSTTTDASWPAGTQSTIGTERKGHALLPGPHSVDSTARRSTSSVEVRGIAGFLEGLVGPGNIEGLISHFLGGGSSSKRSLVGLAEGLAEPIVSGVGGAIGDEIHDILGKLFNRRAFKDLSDNEVNMLFEYINGMNKRELHARFSIKDALKDVAGSSLTSAALEGVEKLFGAFAERSLNGLD